MPKPTPIWLLTEKAISWNNPQRVKQKVLNVAEKEEETSTRITLSHSSSMFTS